MDSEYINVDLSVMSIPSRQTAWMFDSDRPSLVIVHEAKEGKRFRRQVEACKWCRIYIMTLW